MAEPTQEQMEMAFMQDDAVLADDGMSKDPVSGNDIPSGSMAEEVRDDVPAMLSEGEYVVPADVVRYHGIQKFEDLRDEAKLGMMRMEQDGRIGGAPVNEDQGELPFSLEELETTEAYRGGIMGFADGGDTGTYETAFGQPFTPNQRYGSMGAEGLGFQLRNFTNPTTGKTITVPFFNGKPMQYIPPEFMASDVAGTGGTGGVSDDRDRQEDEAERARTTGATDSAFGLPSAFDDMKETPTSFADFTAEDWQRYNSQRRGALTSITRKIPILGYFQGLNEKAARDFALEAVRTGKNPETGEALSQEEINALNSVATAPLNKSLLESLQTVIDQQQPDFLELEQDRTISADPNVPTSAVAEGTSATTTAGNDFLGEEQLGELGGDSKDDIATVAGKAAEVLKNETPETLENKPEKKSLVQKIMDTGYAALSTLGDATSNFSLLGAAYAGGMEGLDYSSLDSEAYNVGLRDYNALNDADKNRIQRLVRSEAIGEGDVGMATVFRSVITRYGLTKSGAVPLNTFNPGINLSGTNTQTPRTLTKENLTFNDIINGQRAQKSGNVIYQYSPVDDKSINKVLTKDQKIDVDNAIALATNTTDFAKALYKEGLKTDQIFEVINATSFRRFDAPGAKKTDIGLRNHVVSAIGNTPFLANKKQIVDLTNKSITAPLPTPSTPESFQNIIQPQGGFQNIIQPQPKDVSQLYSRGFTPPDIRPLEVEEMDLPPAVGNIPAVGVGGENIDYSAEKFKDMDQRATNIGVMSDFPKQAGIGPDATNSDAQTQLMLARNYKSPVSKLVPQLTPDFPPIGDTRKVTDAVSFLEARKRADDMEFAPQTTGQRKVTDAKQFLETRSAAQKAVEDALKFKPKTRTKKAKEEKKEEKKEETKKETPKKQERKVPGVSMDKAREASQNVFMQTGDAFAADRAYHEAFTGFTASGELSPTYGFKEGGLASKPKKTKPKKRNAKKGLGGKMAT